MASDVALTINFKPAKALGLTVSALMLIASAELGRRQNAPDF